MTTLLDRPAVPGSLRQINRLTVLRLLRELGPTTKPALAKHTGISRPTISKVVDDLEADGLAARVGLTRAAFAAARSFYVSTPCRSPLSTATLMFMRGWIAPLAMIGALSR